MPTKTEAVDQIDTMPTKRFFVDMFTRDIPLEQAVLDLLDNCVDGAKRINASRKKQFEGCKVDIRIGAREFKIIDNCGGFSRELAKDYAFRFGRPDDQEPVAHSIGQFGIGMKRALFKFGSRFMVRSATEDDTWAIDIDVADWVKTKDWHFPWSDFESDHVSKRKPGTEIIVRSLRPEVALKFSTDRFASTIVQAIKLRHRQFISEGLKVAVNGQHVTATNLYLLTKGNELRPGIETTTFNQGGKHGVQIKIVVAIGQSSPRDAGWYVVCNGRVVIEADRTNRTGWGNFEDGKGKLAVPAFHNQFARFRGIVSFDSEDSALVPWNTTKDDIDGDSPVWQRTLRRMVELMRPAVDFLNDLDADIDEHGDKHSPLLDVVKKASIEDAESLGTRSAFKAPARSSRAVKWVKIQYSKSTKDVEFLKDALKLNSASAVGEKTFDLILDRQKR